jgi:ADP-ribose pyrophosphatase YjhB (NUDIX family)
MNTQVARHSVSVAGVITDDHGRALLIRRRDNHRWEPPGGVLELAESIHDGLRREVREETGLDIEPTALTGVYKNITRGIVALVFRCKVTGGNLSTNDEVTAFQWASQADLDSLMAEAYAIRVLDAIRPDSTAVVRTHDGVRLLTEPTDDA